MRGKKEGLRNIMVIGAFLGFVATLASPFVSLFLYRHDLSLSSIANYYGLVFASAVLSCVVFSYRPVQNARASISIAMVDLILYYLGLIFLPTPWLMIICPVLFGVYFALFWLPFNFVFVNLTDSSDRGTIIGLIFFMFPVIQLITPFLGGSIVHNWDYRSLFALSIAVLTINAVLPHVLLKGKRGWIPEKARIDLRPFGPRLKAALTIQGVQDGIFFFLIPLTTLQVTGGEFGAGIALSILAVGGAGGALIVARSSDKTGDRVTYLRIGAIVSCPLFMIVAMFPTLIVFMVCIGISQLTLYIVGIFIMALAVDKNERNKPSALVSRELLLNLGRAIGAIIMSFLWSMTPELSMGFLVASAAIVLTAIVK